MVNSTFAPHRIWWPIPSHSPTPPMAFICHTSVVTDSVNNLERKFDVGDKFRMNRCFGRLTLAWRPTVHLPFRSYLVRGSEWRRRLLLDEGTNTFPDFLSFSRGKKNLKQSKISLFFQMLTFVKILLSFGGGDGKLILSLVDSTVRSILSLSVNDPLYVAASATSFFVSTFVSPRYN